MKDCVIGKLVTDQPKNNGKSTVIPKSEKLLAYYQEAGPDYEAWSKNFNMHFGYYRKGLNPFDRESMLEQMNQEVLNRLHIDPKRSGTLVDFGCGLGATLRYANKTYSNHDLKGITLVPWQVEQANTINRASPTNKRIEIIEADYCRTPFADNSIDGIVAMESSCYATGSTKSDLLTEIHRVLKPGGWFVIGDGFRKNSEPMNSLLSAAYKKLCTSWSLTELGDINRVGDTLKHIGFKNISMEDISWRVAPSVAHVPATVISFLVKELLFGKRRMSKERWDNLKSPLLTMIVGSCQKHFGYYLVGGQK